jgi:hypothetical protein
MAAASLEPISPELVLVCPELREQATAALPDPVWQAFLGDVQRRSTPEPVETETLSLQRALAAAILAPLAPLLATAAFVVLVTTLLTFVADAVR